MVGPVFGSMPESAAEALLKEVRESVKDLRKWCLGNGEEGFATKLALLELRVRALEKDEPDGVVKARMVAIGHIAVAVAAAASLAMQIFS